MGVEYSDIEKTPRMFWDAHLVGKDFDNTVALTFEPSPGRVGVNEAHEFTVEGLFGVAALQQYKDSGGLRSRAAREVVQELAPDADDGELDELTQRFIDYKLDILLGEIGTTFPDGRVWPRPTQGYIEFRELVDKARYEGWLIDDLILSSGHEPFIEKTYAAWGVGLPTFILGEDTVRKLAPSMPPDQLVKPEPTLMELALRVWQRSYGIKFTHALERNDLERVVYVGDSLEKDGQLARNSGIHFELLDPETSQDTWKRVIQRLDIGYLAIDGAMNG